MREREGRQTIVTSPGDKLLLVKLIEIIKLTPDLSGRDISSRLKCIPCRARASKEFAPLLVARRHEPGYQGKIINSAVLSRLRDKALGTLH